MLKLQIQLFAGADDEVLQGGDPTVEMLLTQIDELKRSLVPKEDYEKILDSNKKLVNQLTNERTVIKETPVKVDTPQDVIKRIEDKVEKLPNAKSSYESIKILTENYRDMEKLGMDVSLVDGNVVAALEKFLEDSNGDPTVFKSLMESNVKMDIPKRR